ncbi:MAG: phage recombination protein Bet [Bacteroidales bacterium]|nr:phage recombination protein Bet [Bacteroidales bacterium]
MTNTTPLAVTTAQQNQVTQVTQQLLLDYLTATTPGLNQSQVQQFLAVSMAFNLNPWKKEVYSIPYTYNGKTTMSIVTGYEVYLKRADLNPNYDGYQIEWNGTFVRSKIQKSGKNGIYSVDALLPKDDDVSCICTVYRKDRKMPVRCEVFYSEYFQGNSMWYGKPRVMLEKVAIARAMRLAFPTEFGGMPYESAELPKEMGLDPSKEVIVDEAIKQVNESQPKQQPQEEVITPEVVTAQHPKQKKPAKEAFCDKMAELQAKHAEAFAKKLELMKIEDYTQLAPSEYRPVYNAVRDHVTEVLEFEATEVLEFEASQAQQDINDVELFNELNEEMNHV